MSDFGVTLQQVVSISSHDNADKLELLHLGNVSYQFVVGKNEFRPDDVVVYFPLDSLIPYATAINLGLPVKEVGAAFRVKSIRLRGQWSEGIVAHPTTVAPTEAWIQQTPLMIGKDVTEFLGVTKYEPPEPTFNIFGASGRASHLRALPTTVHRYDIENLQRYPDVYEVLKDQVVVVTEKVEGSHFWCRIDKDGETIHVGQRNFEIARGDELDILHPFWQTLYTDHLDDVLRKMALEFRGYDITIRGEFVGRGVQSNYYDLAVHTVYVFEIELNGEPVGAQSWLDLTDLYGIKRVPVLAEWNTLAELAPTFDRAVEIAHGKSTLVNKLREGIVIKPATEQYHPEIGRLFIKIRDREYLAQ